MSKRIKILVVDDEVMYMRYKIVPTIQKIFEMYNAKYRTEFFADFLVLDESKKYPNLIFENTDIGMAVVDLKLEGWNVDGFHVLKTIHDFCPDCSKLVISQYTKDELVFHFPDLKIEDFMNVKLECSYASKSLFLEDGIGLLAEKIYPLIRVWGIRDMVEKENELQLSKLTLLKCELRYWFHDICNVMMPISNAQFLMEKIIEDVDAVVVGVCRFLGVVNLGNINKCGSCQVSSMFLPVNTNWFILKREICKFLKSVKIFCEYIMDAKKVLCDGYSDKKELNVNSVIREMVVINEYRMQRKKMSINFVEDDSIPLIELDENLFRRIVQNLISNACDAAVSETVRLFRLEIESKLVQDDMEDCIFLQFRDNGKGWNEEVDRKIWEEGFTTKAALGNGIGLFLVKRIVEKSFGGKIFGRSVENHGSVFEIYIPIKKRNQQIYREK